MTPTRSQSLVALLIIILFVLFVIVGFQANQQALKTTSQAQTPSTSATGGSTGANTSASDTVSGSSLPKGGTPMPGQEKTDDFLCTTDTECVAKVQKMCQVSGTCTEGIQTKCVSGGCQIFGRNGQPAPLPPTSDGGTPKTDPALTPPAPGSPACASKAKGDSNCDGKIDLIDFNIWLSEFNATQSTLNSDFNSDGKVNLADFEMWRGEFTKNN